MAYPYIDNKRLFRHLAIDGQKRQIVFCGGEDDDFFVNQSLGAVNIWEAISIYLQNDKYDQILVLDRSKNTTRLSFPNDEYKNRFENIGKRKVSIDPKNKHKQHKIHTEEDDENSNSSEVEISEEAKAKAKEAEEQINSSGVGAEENLLGKITRTIENNPSQKFAIVYKYPDTFALTANWMQTEINKINIISEWARLPNCVSFLTLSNKRQNNFMEALDYTLNSEEYSKRIFLPRPTKEVFKAFIKRAMCRNHFYCRDIDTIASTAAAEGKALRDFSVRVQKFLKKSQNPSATFLDDLYLDSEKVKSLDEIQKNINELVGLSELKKYVQDLIDSIENNNQNIKKGLHAIKINVPTLVLTGNPGTGKTKVARLLGQLLLNLGIRQKNTFEEISLSSIIGNPAQAANKINESIQKALGGVLYFDNAHLLTENDFGRQNLQVLLQEIDKYSDNLTVILTTYEDKLPELKKVSPTFQSKFNKVIHFADYTEEQLLKMFLLLIDKKNIDIDEEAKEYLKEYISSYCRRGGLNNGHGIDNLFSAIIQKIQSRSKDTKTIHKDDIPEPLHFHAKEAKEFIENLDKEFVGLPKVKEFLRSLYKKQLAAELRPVFDNPAPNNCIFLGNPGTGKTTVARLTGKLFYYLGIISHPDKLVEADPIQDFTSSYVSEYSQKIRNKFDEALGGVLFIDEAYQLANDEQGRRVIDQMVKLMTEPKYLNLIVIMAGYPDEMRKLYEANPGLKRRCPNEVYFDNFTVDELVDIFKIQMEKQKLKIGDNQNSFYAHLSSILANMSHQSHFGNAGAVINFFNNDVLGNQAERLIKEPEMNQSELVLSDLVGKKNTSHKSLNEILTDLSNEFVGLESLKESIKNLANRIRIERLRSEKLGIPNPSTSYNIRFVGNPGTGKTTIARYMAKIFCSLGIITNEEVREYRGVDLKGSYVGQTKDKVNSMFENNVDRVILIDEIYSLYQSNSLNQDSFGLEAIDAIVGCMTDPRYSTCILIIAGYEDKMNAFLDGNQGLASRFPNQIRFPDYSDEECLKIVKKQLFKQGYVIPEDNISEFNLKTTNFFFNERQRMGTNFGNARTAGSYVSQILNSFSKRLASVEDEEITKEMLTTIDVFKDMPE